MACPFGVPQFGKNGRMTKCTMCVHRIDEGSLPACAANCPAEAILCDTPENISRILRQRYSGNASLYGPFAALLQEVAE
jgi:Fe-S-cluster-containing dehydrogenase component